MESEPEYKLCEEGRRGSEEAVPGASVFPSGEPGVSGDFWGSQEGCQGPNGRGGWTPLRPLRGLQETRVATREESGVLGFPSSGSLRTMHGGGSAPSCCAFTHRVF